MSSGLFSLNPINLDLMGKDLSKGIKKLWYMYMYVYVCMYACVCVCVIVYVCMYMYVYF